ncbi:RNA polymerase sigma factor [Microbacteriaceae bacterium VKM Ac-2855]|nr:RNA polymerase sigma factor [Microbacteriaceae bacterium VKM Ac-2855]
MAGGDRLQDASDATLVKRALDGDVSAFEVLARRHGPVMRVFAAKMLGSDIESDDVVQEAFLTGWRRLPELEDHRRVRNWLMRIVSNRAIDRIRVRHEHEDVTEHDPGTSPAQDPSRIVEDRLQLDAVWVALDKLPTTQRRCWLLRETAGYSYTEIADALDLPVATVRGQLARTRKFLLHELEAWR